MHKHFIVLPKLLQDISIEWDLRVSSSLGAHLGWVFQSEFQLFCSFTENYDIFCHDVQYAIWEQCPHTAKTKQYAYVNIRKMCHESLGCMGLCMLVGQLETVSAHHESHDDQVP